MADEEQVQDQIRAAIANERAENSKRQTKRALIGAFVIIPGIVIAVAVVWLLIGRFA
jgi:ABC-type spermidine/putrescine transport system permease subunit II